MNKKLSLPFRFASILIVVAIAFALRVRAANLLPIDFDEDDYLRAAQEFAHLIRTGDWRGFLETNYRPEHPPLAKIAYGLAIVRLPEQPLLADLPIDASPVESLPEDQLRAARTEANVFGTLTVFLLALVDPLGGLALAVHSFTIKYVSQVMLDGLSALLSLCAVMAYVQYKKNARTSWIVLSAIALGLAADSKFLHGTVGFAIALDWLYAKRETLWRSSERWKILRTIFAWGVFALAVFFIANPYLWSNTIEKLQTTLAAVRYTATNPNVGKVNYPIWKPLVWIAASPAAWDGQGDAFLVAPDFFIAIFACFGIKRLWKKEPAYVFWLGLAFITLLLWRTKWPQYILILTAPLSLSAAEGMKALWEGFLEWRVARKNRVVVPYNKAETRRAIPWLAPGLIAFVVLTLFPLLFQVAMSTVNLSNITLRDGLQGGIWREFWGGISGQISVNDYANDGKLHFVGLTYFPYVFNYINIEGFPVFTALWTFLSVGLQTILGIGAALLLQNRGVKFRRGWQALFILPWAIPEAIGAVLWLNIFAPFSGLLALGVAQYGNNFPFSFFMGWEKSPNTILVVLLIASLWYGFPFIMLAASAGLKMLPQDVYDAAAMDGASKWQIFRYITWPLIQPLLIPAIIVRAIFAFNQFYLFLVFIILHENGSVFTLSGLSYVSVYYGSVYVDSAIINIITIVLLAGFIALFNRWSKAGEGVTYA